MHKIPDVKDVDFPAPASDKYPTANGYFRSFLWSIGFFKAVYANKTTLNYYPIVNGAEKEFRDNFPYSLNAEFNKRLNYISNLDMTLHTEMFAISPRIAYNSNTNTVNVLMLRKPCIGKDEPVVAKIEEGMYLRKRYFNILDPTVKFENLAFSPIGPAHPDLT